MKYKQKRTLGQKTYKPKSDTKIFQVLLPSYFQPILDLILFII